jgi:hypothetical protein
MRPQDPFAPLSKKRKIVYAIGAALAFVIVTVLLGSMEGGFSAWELLLVAGIVSIPSLAMLVMIAWLSAGKRSGRCVGPANVKVPVRLLKALPYLIGIVALFYLMKAVRVF